MLLPFPLLNRSLMAKRHICGGVIHKAHDMHGMGAGKKDQFVVSFFVWVLILAYYQQHIACLLS